MTVAKLVAQTSPKTVSLVEMPKDRYGFKYIGRHEASRQVWDGDFGSLMLGAATMAKLKDVIDGYEGFPVVNINVMVAIADRLEDVPKLWLGKEIFVIGTSFAGISNDEHAISFCVNEAENGDRSIFKKPVPFKNGVPSGARILLFRE